jgi:mannose-6-phosphate isomerase-like protein (cupin superfamily)
VTEPFGFGDEPTLPPPIDRAGALHYQWGAKCDGWHLVRGEHLSVIAERMPPGTAETRHRHSQAEQFFFVLSGELTIERNRTVSVVPAGAGLSVPPGVAHEVRNAGRVAAEFLVVSTPPSHGDREEVPRDLGGDSDGR